MKLRWILPPLILCMLVPSGTAVSYHVSKESHTWLQPDAGLLVFIQLDVAVQNGTDAATPAFNPARATFLVPIDAQGFQAEVVQGTARQRVPDALVTTGPAADVNYQAYMANVTGYLSAPSAGSTFLLLAGYATSAPLLQMKLHYAADRLVVYASPRAGYAPESAALGTFLPTAGGQTHAVKLNPGAGFAYDFQFGPELSTGNTRDYSTYGWGMAGLVLGFALAYAGARRGLWSAKAKRFVKGGEMESATMLEARRRALMAALKELETAHDAKEIPDEVHGALKEEFKAQTVRVLRTLEEKKEP